MDAHDDRTDPEPGGIARKLDELAEAVAGLPPDRRRLLLNDLKGNMLADDLKAAIKASGLTHYAIGKAAGIRPEIIDRFISGEREDIRISTAGKIAAVLGLELKQTGTPLKPAAKRSKDA